MGYRSFWREYIHIRYESLLKGHLSLEIIILSGTEPNFQRKGVKMAQKFHKSPNNVRKMIFCPKYIFLVSSF